MGRFTVFLDTNSIIANSYKIDSSPIINHFSKSELIEFVLSQVVIDEVIKNHQKEQNRVLADLEKLRREGSRYGVKILRHIGQTNVAEELNKTLIQLKVNVIDIHQAELNLIYQKAFELRKPFKNKNEKESGGIKDAIIWSSFLSYLEKNKTYEKIIFVCNDNDFINLSTNTFHEDLIEDIKLKGIATEIIILRNIHELVKFLISPSVPYSEEQDFIANEVKRVLKYKKFSIFDQLKTVQVETDSIITQLINTYLDNELEGVLELESITINPKNQIEFMYEVKFLDDNLAYVFFTETYNAGFQYIISSKHYDSNLEHGKIIEQFDIEGFYYYVINESRDWKFDFEVAFDCKTGDVFEINRFNDGTLIE